MTPDEYHPLAGYRMARAWVETKVNPPTVSSTGSFLVSNTYFVPPTTITFNAQGRTVVILEADGSVTIPDGVTLDEASRGFWEAVDQLSPCKKIEPKSDVTP